MKKRRYRIFIAAVAILTTAAFAQENQKYLSLDDCIVRALENNLNLAAEVLNPEIADLSVTRAGEKFLPLLSFGYSNRDTNTASYSFIDAADQVRSTYTDYMVSFNQLIPTGGQVNISLSSYKNDTNRSFQTINPRYGSTLTFDFVQPLLKNFGYKASRREIIIAKNTRDISENQFRQLLLETIYSVERAYWNLAYSIDNLKVRRQSLQLALDLLEENKRKIEVGTMPPIEIYTAEAEVANQKADILAAEALVRNNQDRLRRIINIPLDSEENAKEILPSDKPKFDKREITFEDALNTALEKRPDLEVIRIDLKTKKYNVRYANNQLLPELNLQASYWSPGISGDQILYLDDDPFTRVIVGTLPGPASDALKEAFRFKYQNWSVGLVLNVPLNTILSRAASAQAKLALEQAQWKLKDLEQEVILEIRTAMRNVETNYQRVQAYRAARELADKKLEAEQEKFRVGKSTNFFLLQYQRDAGDARSAELRSLVDYVLSLADLDRVLGTTFETKNITFSGISVKQDS
ncbi:MAG: TolC family protein [Candidatus Aminicenantes bacterium]|nr:TolC family protein [Candidatus Aminicenantes bacterium]